MSFKVLGKCQKGIVVALGQSRGRRDGQIYDVHPESPRVIYYSLSDAERWRDQLNSEQNQKLQGIKRQWWIEERA